jgi:hypothetical protein
MCSQLTAVGYHHFVALAGFERDCAALHARWREVHHETGVAAPGAAPGAAEAAAARAAAEWPLPACVIASAPAHGTPERIDFHGFWAGRYALLADLVARGVNAMLLDLDIVLHRDVYADLYEPCMRRANVVAQAEGGGPNAGFFYVRGAHPDGAAHWVVAQIKRRVDLFFGELNATGKLPGFTWEQDILKDAVRVASMPNGSEWDMGANRDREHRFWAAHPQNDTRREWRTVEVLLSGDDDAAWCQGPRRFNASGTGALTGAYGLGSPPRSMHQLFKPDDAPGVRSGDVAPEYMLYAPGYFSQFGNVVSRGWNNGNPTSVMTHMLKAGATWLPTVKEAENSLSHVTRLANMQAHGFWHARIHEARAADKALLFLKPSVVDAASAHANVTQLRRLIARALHAAALSNRTLVLPELPCGSPWIIRNPDSNRHGIGDLRIFVVPATHERQDDGAGGAHPPRCYVGAHAYEFCWPWDHVAFAFDPIAARRFAAASAQPAAVWDRAALSVRRDDVVLHHLPFVQIETEAAGDAAVKRVEHECHNYFDKHTGE